MLDTNLDEQIKLYEKKIKELKLSKKEQEKKLETIEELNNYIARFCEKKDINLEDVYASQTSDIEKWIKSLAKNNADSRFYLNLKKHFQSSVSTSNKVKKKISSKPRLEIGVYEHPQTKEKVEKIKRNPKQLDDWIEEYGLDTVQTWKR